MRIEHAFDFGHVTLYDLYLIGEAHFGVHFGEAELRATLTWAQPHYREPFGYISVRTHDHSRDLSAYRILSEYTHVLASLAVVHPKGDPYRIGELERKIAIRYLKIALFDSTEDAVAWTVQLVKNARAQPR
ncbi:MAG: hypothetical protein R2834_13225 [Rhodothermales bacterium]